MNSVIDTLSLHDALPILLRRMRKVMKRKKLIDRVLVNAVNVLSVIHANVYFPTFTNGLKDIGAYLGCTWAAENSSGLQSLDRKSTRLNSSHTVISYAVFC